MASSLPKVSGKDPIVDKTGRPTFAFIKFLEAVFTRAGGFTAPTNLELQSNSSDISTLQTNYTALEARVSAVESEQSPEHQLGLGPEL